MEHSLSMAASLAAAGFTTVYCTPHLMPGCYEASNDQVRNAVADLQGRLSENSIPLTLLPGREYWLDEFLPTLLEDPLPLGNTQQILIEIPFHLSGDMVRQLLYRVVHSGFTPVIAHPERCPLLEPFVRRAGYRGLMETFNSLLAGGRRGWRMHSKNDATGNPLLDYLRDLGCSFQGNLGSFNGFYGVRAKAVAEELRQLGVYDRYGSDLHSPEHAHMILGAVTGLECK